jgi:hypothetical protein
VAQVESQAPPEQVMVAVWAFEHARAHPPQSAVFVAVFVSHPLEGSPVQWPKPVSHASVQSLLHDPSMGLQHVVPVQMTEPPFCG